MSKYLTVFLTTISFILLTFLQSVTAQPHPIFKVKSVMDSGGELSREQAAYDVKFYRINMKIDPANKSIDSKVFVRAVTIDTLTNFVLDLSSTLTIDAVTWKGSQQNGSNLKYKRIGGKVWVTLPSTLAVDESIEVEITYHGIPKVSINPPWDDGFVWTKTKTGETWAGVACEEEGADIWWPCKDHPSDEPDSVDLYFTVPSGLTCVSNGVQKETINNGSTNTFHWYVSEPINNYDVTFYLGPYQKITVSYQSVTGNFIPAEYWFLPYSVDKAKQYTSTFLKDFGFFEETIGPFPFRAEKYGLVEAPYWGMEHQTAVAYGNNFALNSYGFDYIHLHEVAHEWWGNLVTAKDWSDVWIHEGFATYMEALFVEKNLGADSYKKYMGSMRNNILNAAPIAPAAATTASVMFSSNDVYYKGAWVLHTLRYIIGDTDFFKLLKTFAYPTAAMENATDGSQCRLVTTDDFITMAKNISGKDLDWFFALYLRKSDLPKLQYNINNNTLFLKWTNNKSLPFYLPVEVKIGNTITKVEMGNGSGSAVIPAGQSYQIDPNARILMGSPVLVSIENETIPEIYSLRVYPNPANPAVTIQYSIPERTEVSVKIFDVTGCLVEELSRSVAEAGTHKILWIGTKKASGVYICRVETDKKIMSSKILLMK